MVKKIHHTFFFSKYVICQQKKYFAINLLHCLDYYGRLYLISLYSIINHFKNTQGQNVAF